METVIIDKSAGIKLNDVESNVNNEQTDENKSVIPDGGYGWIVLLATFLIYAIAEGISFAFGLLFVEFLYEFNGSKSATSWVGSLFVALPLISGPVCSTLVDKYGCQKMTILGSAICALGFALSAYAKNLGLLYLTFGVLGGLARGLCYITVVVTITYWFEKRRSVALGISASGTGFGTIVFAPFTNYLLYEYGWRGTVLILGGCLAQMCVCGALMTDPKWVVEEELQKMKDSKRKEKVLETKELEELLPNKENKEINDVPIENNVENSKKTWYRGFLRITRPLKRFALFLELHFLLLSVAVLLAGTWFLIPYFYLVDHMLENGYSEEESSLALSVIGFANIVGMVLLGWIGDRCNLSRIYGLSLILCGMSIWGMIIFTNSYILIIGCSASFGFFFSSCFALSPSLLAELVPIEKFTTAFGFVLLCEGVGHLTGPPLAGYISDVSKSWSQSFCQAGLWMIVSGFSVGTISFTKNRKFFQNH
ncbi:monocarboxylate transporter 12-like [Diorhabda sublineata]|uniref:monocarboxylate transporter 12-like n=1 Tax=Diorhabda sublineata TaxID=1163346 RepID=UPI0024E0C6C6|nr:monocarboxylate transporter 12-like [Diorhabda sublineata]